MRPSTSSPPHGLRVQPSPSPDREHADVAVQCEVPAGLSGVKRRHDVRHHLVWRNDPVFDAVPGQQLPDVTRRIARVAGRVRARTADEAAGKIEQDLPTDGDPLQ